MGILILLLSQLLVSFFIFAVPGEVFFGSLGQSPQVHIVPEVGEPDFLSDRVLLKPQDELGIRLVFSAACLVNRAADAPAKNPKKCPAQLTQGKTTNRENNVHP